MRVLFLALLVALPLAATAEEDHDEDHEHAPSTEAPKPVEVPENRAVIQVEGLVCSFCAFGAEKAMADLDMLDRSQFSNGVHVDIEQHRMTLALVPDAQLPFYEIYTSIRAAGYEPKKIHFRVTGEIERSKDGVRIRVGRTGEQFALTGDAVSSLEPGATVLLQTYLDTTTEPKKKPEGPRVLVVTKLLDS